MAGKGQRKQELKRLKPYGTNPLIPTFTSIQDSTLCYSLILLKLVYKHMLLLNLM